MKNMIALFAATLFLSRFAVPCHAAISDDMDAIMYANASPAASNERHARWVFETSGTSVKVYMFARKSGHSTSTLNIQVGSGTVNAFPSTNSYSQSISIGCSTGQSVLISIRINAGNVFPSDNWDADEYGHFKVLNISGFDIKSGANTMTIPPGLWLGMEDSPNHTGVTYDYNDFCVVLVGCKAKFQVRVPVANQPLVPTPPATVTWDNKDQSSRFINMVNGILSRSAEDKY
jgi:hypothetical protein